MSLLQRRNRPPSRRTEKLVREMSDTLDDLERIIDAIAHEDEERGHGSLER